MNFGTKLRTILAVATSLNTALMATDITEFNSPALDIIASKTGFTCRIFNDSASTRAPGVSWIAVV